MKKIHPSSSEAIVHKAPVPPIKNWEAGIERQRRQAERPARHTRQPRSASPAQHMRGVAWEGDARFSVPAGSIVESENGLSRIRVSLARDAVLTIVGADGMLAALDLAEPQLVAGRLTVNRHPSQPKHVKSIMLTVGPCISPRFELQSSKRQVRGAVWSKKLDGSRLSIVRVPEER